MKASEMQAARKAAKGEHFNKATKYVTSNIRNQFRKDLVQAEII